MFWLDMWMSWWASSLGDSMKRHRRSLERADRDWLESMRKQP